MKQKKMKLRTKEPDFSRATILLGDSIAEQLIESSRRSRPRWSELFAQYSDDEIRELMLTGKTRKTLFHPLVRGFLTEWARNTTWGIKPPLYTDAVPLDVPKIFVDRLRETGGVEGFALLLADRGEFCSATLASSDDHDEFMLLLNCPAWLEIASVATYSAGFERQLASTIQHEMAHFRHVKTGARGEIHAHCRGIASVVPASATREQFYDFVEADFPEFTHNDEIRSLVLSGSASTWRLMRCWQRLFSTTRNA